MISVIGIFFYMCITCYILGFGCYELLAGKRNRKERVSRRTWTGCIYAGVAVTVCYAQFFSIFHGVGLGANLGLVLLCILCMLVYRREWKEEISFLWRHRNIGRQAIYVLLFLLFAYGTSRGLEHYDTGLYHAQSIRWVEEYGVVKGLGNLHSRLAYNSAAFPWTALYSFRFLGGQSFHCGAGFLAWLLAVVCVGRFWKRDGDGVRLSDFARVMAGYYLLNIFDEMISPASDYFMVLLVFYLVIRWLELIEEESGYFPYAMLCVLGVTVLTMKLSGAVILLLVLVPAWQLIRQKKWCDIAVFLSCGFLAALPYFIRNVLLSGWLIYPFTSIDLFSVSYKIPKGTAEYDAREIKVWGRGYRDVNRYGESMMKWLPDWFRSLSATDRCFCVLAVSGLILFVVVLIWTLAKLQRNRVRKGITETAQRQEREVLAERLQILFVTGVINVCFVFWMMTSPLVRYGCVFLWLTAVLNWGYGYLLFFVRLDRGRCAVAALCLLGIYKAGMFGMENIQSFTPQYFVWQKDYEHFDTIEYEMNGIAFYYSGEGDRTGYDVFPASPWQMEDILIGETIQEGFIHDRKDR